MKRIRVLIVVLFALLVMPNKVSAAQVSITCSNVVVGNNTECVIRGSASAMATIDARITASGGVTMTSITAGTGFTPLENSIGNGKSGSIAYLTEADKVGSFVIARVTLHADSVGPATFTISSPRVTESEKDVVLSDASASFMVNEVPTQPTQQTRPSTEPTTQNTKKPNPITSPTQGPNDRPEITSPVLSPLKLLSLTVDDFEVIYQDGEYYVNTESYTESVTITATAEEGVSIFGSGVRNLTFGKNVVEIILKNTSGQSNTYRVIITRPDDLNAHDTRLTSLRIVGYNFAFSPDQKEYTVNVPYNVDEIYVIAETLNSDVNIAGAGLKTLTKGKNQIYIKVSYGESQATDYVITIKRSYSLMILFIGAGLLGAGLVASLVYAYINRKAVIDMQTANRNRLAAGIAQQAVPVNAPSVSVNGQSVMGEGRRMVVPTKVVSVKTPTHAIKTDVPTKPLNMNGNTVKSAPEAQVKVYKPTPIQQPIPSQVNINPLEEENNNI